MELIKSPILRLYFLIISFLKFGFIFLLPNSPSNLAPDEGTYAKIAYWFAAGVDLSNPDAIGLYQTSRSFIVPAGLLHKVGVPSLNAIRLVSVTYGLLAILVFILLLRVTYPLSPIIHVLDFKPVSILPIISVPTLTSCILGLVSFNAHLT